MTLSLSQKVGIQPELRQHFVTLGSVGIPLATPVNAVVAGDDIEVGVLALLANGDTATVTVPGVAPYVFTRAAATSIPDNEFVNAAGLATLVNAIPGLDGVNNAGVVEIRSTVGGDFWNGVTVAVEYLADTTAGGGAGAAATATIAAADIAELAVGDTITFDGVTYTRAGATSVPAAEFVNTAGLAACIDAQADWGAVVNVADVDITAAANGAIWNGITVDIAYNRDLAGGVDGTPGVLGAVCIDANRIYVSRAAGGLENASWERTADLTFAAF
jgi:hypothetical protein